MDILTKSGRSAFVLRSSHLDKRDIAAHRKFCACYSRCSSRLGRVYRLRRRLLLISGELTSTAIVSAKHIPYRHKKQNPQSIALNRMESIFPKNPSRAFLSTWDETKPTSINLKYWNGIGGFANDGREYRIRGLKDSPSPMPWSNVIANPRFGTLVTESGGGYTWAENSRENKLTSWANDPVVDEPGEILLIRDEISRDSWLRFQSQNDHTSRTLGPSWTRLLSLCQQIQKSFTRCFNFDC